jgi:hypothetical protein
MMDTDCRALKPPTDEIRGPEHDAGWSGEGEGQSLQLSGSAHRPGPSYAFSLFRI